jgi:23S rRNA pseudouridine955/2504/2580 synthase
MNEIHQNKINFYRVTDADDQQRIDNLLLKLLKGVPKSHIYRIIRQAEVRINKKRCKVSTKVSLDDLIRIPPLNFVVTMDKAHIPASNFPIIFEDEFYLIINKPDGIACHGGSGIAYGVIEQLRQTQEYKFLELAHRLDKETSGILILAKKRQALVKIQDLIKNQQMTKEYYALTLGIWVDDKRNLKAPILKYINADGERRVRIDPLAGKFAHTKFTVIQRFNNFTLVNADLQTGRTHQIRIHCNHLHYPIAGDDKYGNFESNKDLIKNGLKRMFLHAHHTQFIHPITHKTIDLNCPLPENLTKFLNTLKG